MQTRVIGLGDKVFNIFTKSGRQRNSIYREMRQQGLYHIRQRKLSDNTRVILGYKNSMAKLAKAAYMIKPDLSTENKIFNKINGYFPYIIIEKTWKNPEGEQIRKEAVGTMYDNNGNKYWQQKEVLKDLEQI